MALSYHASVPKKPVQVSGVWKTGGFSTFPSLPPSNLTNVNKHYRVPGTVLAPGCKKIRNECLKKGLDVGWGMDRWMGGVWVEVDDGMEALLKRKYLSDKEERKYILDRAMASSGNRNLVGFDSRMW